MKRGKQIDSRAIPEASSCWDKWIRVGPAVCAITHGTHCTKTALQISVVLYIYIYIYSWDYSVVLLGLGRKKKKKKRENSVCGTNACLISRRRAIVSGVITQRRRPWGHAILVLMRWALPLCCIVLYILRPHDLLMADTITRKCKRSCGAISQPA